MPERYGQHWAVRGRTGSASPQAPRKSGLRDPVVTWYSYFSFGEFFKFTHSFVHSFIFVSHILLKISSKHTQNDTGWVQYHWVQISVCGLVEQKEETWIPGLCLLDSTPSSLFLPLAARKGFAKNPQGPGVPVCQLPIKFNYMLLRVRWLTTGLSPSARGPRNQLYLFYRSPRQLWDWCCMHTTWRFWKLY